MQALLKCVGRELAMSFVALQGFASVGFMYFLVPRSASLSSFRIGERRDHGLPQ